MNPLLKTNSAISSRVFYYILPEVDGGGLEHFAIGQRGFTSVPIPYLVSNILNLLNHNFGYWKAFNGKWKVDQESERTTADAESESLRFDQISCSLCVSRHAVELKEFFFLWGCVGFPGADLICRFQHVHFVPGLVYKASWIQHSLPWKTRKKLLTRFPTLRSYGQSWTMWRVLLVKHRLDRLVSEYLLETH